VADKQELVFSVPKTASWHFKLFPHKTLDPIAQTNVEVKGLRITPSKSYQNLGENHIELSVDPVKDVLQVKYSIATLDPSRDGIWIGVFYCEEGNQRQWRRRKVITDKSGVWECKKMIHAGTYEARLFACGTYEVRDRSASLTLDGLAW
jgi:hypothetical protein